MVGFLAKGQKTRPVKTLCYLLLSLVCPPHGSIFLPFLLSLSAPHHNTRWKETAYKQRQGNYGRTTYRSLTSRDRSGRMMRQRDCKRRKQRICSNRNPICMACCCNAHAQRENKTEKRTLKARHCCSKCHGARPHLDLNTAVPMSPPLDCLPASLCLIMPMAFLTKLLQVAPGSNILLPSSDDSLQETRENHFPGKP